MNRKPVYNWPEGANGMIKNYYKSIRGQKLAELMKPKRGTWIYAENPTDKELRQLTSEYNLEPTLLTDALDEDETPRLDSEGGVNYMFVRFAFTKSDGEVDTAPILFILTKDVVITVCSVRLTVLSKFTSSRVNFATTQRAKLVLLILQEIVNNYDTYIAATSRKIRTIRSRLRGRGISNKDLADFVVIGDELNEFLSALQPTSPMLKRLSLGRHIPLYEEDRDLIDDLLINNEQSIEVCKSNIKSIVNIREAYAAISSNNLNRILAILTIVTIVMSVPGIFMGLYGLNIPLPFQHTEWIFWAIVAANITLMGSVVYIARKKRVI